MERLLDAKEVAELLNVPLGWVRERTRDGRIPHLRFGRYRRYRRESIVAWVAENEGQRPDEV